ncbi:GNAT family N-acetyltransferase [Neomicrococcus lactis]
MFSRRVTDHWIPQNIEGLPLEQTPFGEAVVHESLELPEKRPVELLRPESGPSILTFRPEYKDKLADITLHEADYVFYIALADQAAYSNESPLTETRKLTAEDAVAFAQFQQANTEDDLDEAEVSLDDLLVYGTFRGDRLVSVASMYTWPASREGSVIADIGVITDPNFRGQGLGALTVRGLSREALSQGLEPQYRCNLENTGSKRVAESAGFTLYAQWQALDLS